MEKFESAFNQVRELVEDFKTNESEYLSASYQEAEVRRDFIDKFFEALGWDVYHIVESKNLFSNNAKKPHCVSYKFFP